MPSSFTRHDRQLHRRVYEAVEGSPDHRSIAAIRDEAVARHDTASTFVVAFSTILQRHKIARSGVQWLPFNEYLKDQTIAKEKRFWKHHLEQLAFISMQWSPEIVSDYGWTAESMGRTRRRDHTKLLYKCAQMYPRFDQDFLRQLNLVRWLQYTADILNDINSLTIRLESSLRNKDLQYLVDLHASKSAIIRGIEVKPDSAARHFEKHIRTWTETDDGRVSVQGRTIDLQTLKPKHWNMHALCTDRYGLLLQRDLSQWRTERLPAAMAQELHSYPFGNQSMESEIITNDCTDVEEAATEGMRGGPDLTPNSDICTLTTGAVSNSAMSSEPIMVFSDSVDCSPSDMDPRQTSKASRNRTASLNGETSLNSHYNLRPEDCLCSICQDLRPFLDKMRSDYLRSGCTHLQRVRKEWLSHARWASRDNTWSSSIDRTSGFDIWSLDESSLEELANDSSVLDKPLVITEPARDCAARSMESVQTVIRDNHYENEVEHFLSLLSKNEQPTASCFLRDPFQVHDPKFMRFGRFTVLQRASMRAFNSLLASSDASNHCCMDPLHNSSLASGLSSVRVETTGAASGPHVSALGGRWFRILVGRRLCALAKTSDLHRMEGDRSSTSGQDWIPNSTGIVRLILLESNDVLILPPGIAFLHFAVDPSATLEGHFWDEGDVDRYLQATETARQEPSFVSDVPPCLPRRIFDGYQSIARGSKSKGVRCQRPIGDAGQELSKRWRSCLHSEESRVENAISKVSPASGSCNSSFAHGNESDTRREADGRGADRRYRAKRVCIR
jgi:hypothetical protein